MYCTVPFWIKQHHFPSGKLVRYAGISGIYNKLTSYIPTVVCWHDAIQWRWRHWGWNNAHAYGRLSMAFPRRWESHMRSPWMMRNVCWDFNVFFSVLKQQKFVEVGSCCSPPSQKWQLKLDFRTKPETLRVFLLLKMYLVTNSLILKGRNLKLLRFLMCDFGVATSQTPGWQCWVGDFTIANGGGM